MTTTDTVRLWRPDVDAETAPTSPAQLHGHPFVWAWNVIAGATSRDYIESACRQAEDEGADPQAVYKTLPSEPTMPNTWFSVDTVSEPVQGRVRAYVAALTGRTEVCEELPVLPKAPLPRRSEPAPAPQQEPAPPEHEYAISYIARLTGVVTASSYEDALAKLVPPGEAGPAGDTFLNLTSEGGVAWRAHFDAESGRADAAESKRVSLRKTSVLRQIYEDKPKLQ